MTLSANDGRAERARGVKEAAGRVIVACALVAVVIAVGGATRNWVEGVIWVGEAVTGGVIGLAVARFLIPPSWFLGPQWRPVLAIAAGVSVPMGVVVLALNVLVHHLPLNWAVTREVLASVFFVSLAMTALSFLIRNRPTATHAGAPDAPPPKFLERVPAKLKGSELFAVEAEDHYLRLHTSLGQDLILMRLGDAIAELEGIEGAQTHRSWWVAKAAVVSAERSEGRATLTLKDGAEVPVSRGFAKPLREAGWF